MSGSETISISGTPERLTSTRLYGSPVAESVACCRRAVSSSRWTRVMPMRFVSPPTSISSQPFLQIGMSYSEIW
jgi:hypothetical protein